jgi:hypothetical protein
VNFFLRCADLVTVYKVSKLSGACIPN